jgi:hypothetical protein
MPNLKNPGFFLQVLVPELQKRRIRQARQTFMRKYAVRHVNNLAGEG